MAVARASPSRKAVRRQPSAHRMGRAIISTAASTPLAAQLARVSEPMDQKTICCSASAEDWYWMSASMAWKKNTKPMPNSTMVSAFAPRITAAITIMAVATAAASHAISARLNCGCAISCHLSTMEVAPPNAAAAEMPRVKGSASGLLRMVCISAPAKDRAMPMSTAITAMGRRSCHSTVRVWSSSPAGFTMPFMTSAGLISIAPTKLLIIKATAAISVRPATMPMRCQVNFLCCRARAATSAPCISWC